VLSAAAAALLLMAPAAPAATITVDTTSQVDAVDGACSIREAFSNARFGGQVHSEAGECAAGLPADPVQPDADTIEFASSFNGELADTITVTGGLPEVFDTLTIDGGDCDPGPAAKPCVGVEVPPNQQSMWTNGFDDPQLIIRGLSITGGFRALLQASPSGSLTVKGSWIGVRLDGTANGSETGLVLQSNNTIGGTTAQDRNVISAGGIGIEIRHGTNNTIQGNYFGTEPDGDRTASMRSSNSNIFITGSGSNTNRIGGPDSGTPGICDGSCNLLAGAGVAGIDLTGGAFVPGGPTAIEGNFIGLGLDGAQAYSDTGDGITVGFADQVSIGDGTAAGRNYIAGNGGEDIEVANGADDLEISNNFIGLNATGTAKLPAGGASEIFSSANDISFTDNRVGGKRVVLNTNGSTLTGNVFGVGVDGEDVGYASGVDGPLAVFGDDNVIGGTDDGEGNVFGNTDNGGENAAALRIAGSSNDVFGNLIGVDADGNPAPNASNGVSLIQVNFDQSANQIGGTGAGEANVISNSGGDAIHAPAAAMTADEGTFVANTGQANGTNATDLFIDLGTDGPGNGDGGDPPAPNGGIEAPEVVEADTTHIEGTTLQADGTTVQVYRARALRGDARSYLGQATVASGEWSFGYPTPLGAGVCVAAAQTAGGKGTSEMAVSVIGGDSDCDTTGPVASFTSGPNGPVNQRTAAFAFGSNEPGSTFMCKLDDGAPFACIGSATTGQLSEGAHTFRITPTDTAQNEGDPVTRSWSVDTVAPESTISRAQVLARKRRVKVFFAADDPGASFRCKLDARAFASCGSPVTYKKLKPGRHTIQVIATDAPGNAEATPALRKVRLRR
jgi:hypothetical protein